MTISNHCLSDGNYLILKDAGAGKNSFYDDGVRDTVTEMETFAADVEEEVVLASRRHHSRSVMSRSPMIKTVEFVTINPELEDTLSVSSSSQSRWDHTSNGLSSQHYFNLFPRLDHQVQP